MMGISFKLAIMDTWDCIHAVISIKFDGKANNTNLSHFFNKHGSNGKNISSLSSPPKSLEKSDSSKSSKMKVSDVVNK